MICDETQQAVVGLHLKGQVGASYENFSTLPMNDDLLVFRIIKQWLVKYFNGENPSITNLPISLNGSSFQQIIWSILLKVPYATTVTYGEVAVLAAQMMRKMKMSSQAVGGAVGCNPISIIVPCHRVVAANNKLGGYGGGIRLKLKLLKIEGIDLKRFKLSR